MLEEIESGIRDCNYERDSGFTDFTMQDSINVLKIGYLILKKCKNLSFYINASYKQFPRICHVSVSAINPFKFSFLTLFPIEVVGRSCEISSIFILCDHFLNSHNNSVLKSITIKGENWYWSLPGLQGLNYFIPHCLPPALQRWSNLEPL